MDSLVNDHRFSRAFSDPRFRPMPTIQKKVKIDKRFKAVLSSKDYGHRLLLDKRGRPIYDVSKRGKHEMERYYQISSDDSGSSDDEEDTDKDMSDDNDKKTMQKSQDLLDADSDSPVATPSRKMKKKELEKKTGKKKKNDDNKDELVSGKKSKDKKPPLLSKKRTLADQVQEDDESCEERPAAKRLKKKGDVTADKKKKPSSIKKRTLIHVEEEDDCNEKPAAKQPKRKEELVSDDENNEDIDDDEDNEDIDDDDEEEEETSSDSESSDEEVSGEDEEEVGDTTNYVTVMKKSASVDHSWNELHSKAPIVSESTHRLAVCNMDWDFVKAQDLFVLFKSFAGEGGSVRSVTIYPSEFGKERMAEDAVLGPREMRGQMNGDDNEYESEESESEDAPKNKKKNRRIDSEILKRKAKEAVKAENEALRGYQLNRLRYYFAVVDCNAVETADAIYKECDGMEYQLSSIRLDLRYIPDDMTFDDPPKDSFSDEQRLGDFQPNYFRSTALSQGKVNVTWDETDFDRIRNKITNAQREELEQIVEENRYADTIAPPESDSDSDDDERPQWLQSALGEDEQEKISEEKRISLYRKVLMDKLVEDKEKQKKTTEVDKELEWTAGLKTAYETKLKRSEKIKEDSQGVVVDKYLERRREKRRNRLQKKAELAKSEGAASDEDSDGIGPNDMPDIIDDSLKEMMESEGHNVNSIKNKKKKKLDKKKASTENQDDSEAEREKAELELLLMRDDDEKRVAKPEKVKEKLSRRQKKKLSMQKSERKKLRKEGRLTIDVEDPRFGAMFTSHHFHLDPNHGQFRKTKNNMKLLDEQIKRMSTKAKKEKPGKNVQEDIDNFEDSRSVSKKLVESLKSKMKK